MGYIVRDFFIAAFGSDEGATDGMGAPGLMSLSFFSFSVYAVRIAEKLLAFVPRNTVLRSLSSTSFCLIFLTTSTSCVSARYLRFEGDIPAGSARFVPGVEGNATVAPLRRGEPGGVVDSATNETILS